MCRNGSPASDGYRRSRSRSRSRSRRGERAKRRRCRRNVRRDVGARSVAGRRTTTLDLGSPSRRGAIIRSSLIKLREMSKDSTMPARRTMRTQIITSLGRPVLLSSTSTSTCIRVYVCTCVRVYVCTCVRVYVSSVYTLRAALFCALVVLSILQPPSSSFFSISPPTSSSIDISTNTIQTQFAGSRRSKNCERI